MVDYKGSTKRDHVKAFAVMGFVLFAAMILSGCSTTRHNTVTQFSTIDALLAGAYDGQTTCDEMLKKGGFGIGTFDGLDGEMLVLDGNVYQIRSDGKIYTPSDTETSTPFASVVNFSPEQSMTLDSEYDFKSFGEFVDERVPNKNIFCAVKVTGTFSLMHTRSVPAQEKPYPPLSEVTKNQPEFEKENVSGAIVGFRSPAFVKGIGVPGYHLHFLSDDKDFGGHILGFVMQEGIVEVDQCHQFNLILPAESDSEFSKVDLTQDRSNELKEVEQ
jgi:acetolactate decarboxylase